MDTASKPRCWHKFHGGRNIWDTQLSRSHFIPVAARCHPQQHTHASQPMADSHRSSTHTPVSQWPTATHWRKTNKLTNGQIEEQTNRRTLHCNHVKPLLLQRGLINCSNIAEDRDECNLSERVLLWLLTEMLQYRWFDG